MRFINKQEPGARAVFFHYLCSQRPRHAAVFVFYVAAA